MIGIYGKCTFNFKELPNCFPLRVYHLAFLPAVHESSSHFASLSDFGIVSVFYFSHSSGCGVVSHCGFNLQSVND